MSYICHIDEAGCSESLPATKSDVQPLLVIAGLIAHEDAPPYITREFLALKRRYCPGAFTSKHRLDDVRQEIKRAGLRRAIRKHGTRARTPFRFIDDTLTLLERFERRLLATVWVKGVAIPFKARETCTRSVQHACRTFPSFLDEKDSAGLVSECVGSSCAPALRKARQAVAVQVRRSMEHQGSRCAYEAGVGRTFRDAWAAAGGSGTTRGARATRSFGTGFVVVRVNRGIGYAS
ncbi:hypothetical protein [Paraburkholderia caballeronis]|uniref:hypothetical protein n=1 Tax=Paraburkholderia caballeronis TaxID=416943 RepID=UPI0010649F44|nr:hypothetical protein [Paraburkholderia caballeronis]TDV17249.1 hypothetical protein C7406_106174 [Paraburkholderia caballeronis]TDV17634.1 hypothetical protein C7408_104295 [Paraburkholderia caballeronis]TDV27652.1 hypothetical protein C7404_104295 [Paraburkholderia caballeronis]